MKDLAHKIKLAIGIKIMVTDNVETDLGITNGAQGEMSHIILHPDELQIDNSPVRQL